MNRQAKKKEVFIEERKEIIGQKNQYSQCFHIEFSYALNNSITVISGMIPTLPGYPRKPKPRFTYKY